VRLLTQAALSPLEVAAEKGFVDVIDLLIARGASPNYLSKSGTALSAAIREMQLEAVQALLLHGANPNQSSPDAFFEKDFPPLLAWGWRAAEDTRSTKQTKLAILQTLLDAGANAAAPYTMRDTNGADLLELTAPIWAFVLIPSNHLGILKDVSKILMQQPRKGSNVEINVHAAKARMTGTCDILHMFIAMPATKNKLDLVKSAVELGADPAARCRIKASGNRKALAWIGAIRSGDRPIDIARRQGDAALVAGLQKAQKDAGKAGR
jgi:ankyrin repeat protein